LTRKLSVSLCVFVRRHSLYSLRTVIEWSYNGNFEGVPSYPDFSRFGKPSHSVTSFTRHQQPLELGKESIEYVQRYQLTL
jgi:hypothetical protein